MQDIHLLFKISYGKWPKHSTYFLRTVNHSIKENSMSAQSQGFIFIFEDEILVMGDNATNGDGIVILFHIIQKSIF